jgi:hypothetical protein
MKKPARNQSKKPIITGFPPWHTVLLIGLCFGVSLSFLPSLDSMDEEIANRTTLTRSVGLFSVAQISIIRIVFGCIMIGDSLYAVLWGRWEQDTEYFDGSKLCPCLDIPFRGMWTERPTSFSRGLMTLSSFTMWAWLLEGVAFLLLGVLAFSPQEHVYLNRVTVVLWEMAAPTSLLVSSIVKYVLWPTALNGGNTNNANILKHPCALLEHNLNSIAALFEAAYLGGLPVRMKDASFGVLFGLTYLLYSYFMMHRWTEKKPNIGPQFIYPFLDTTLGTSTSLCMLGLLAVLITSHGLFSLADSVLSVHPYLVVIIATVVCRFRD